MTQKLAITEAVSAVEKERDELKSGLERAELEKQLAEKSLKDKYETQIKDRDDTIERLRDMKARLSTKMVGETLEQHCETEFNRIRATAFPRAYFEKDNDARTGSKGDYIFRDSDEAGTEIVSIMFEMKNESDRTATKNKNEDFLEGARQGSHREGLRVRGAGLLARARQRALQHRDRRRLPPLPEDVRRPTAVLSSDHHAAAERGDELSQVQDGACAR